MRRGTASGVDMIISRERSNPGEPSRRVHRHMRPVGEKCGIGLAPQRSREIWRIDVVRRPREPRSARRPDLPSWVTHLVLHRASIALTRVAPRVLSDELLLASGANRFRRAGDRMMDAG